MLRYDSESSRRGLGRQSIKATSHKKNGIKSPRRVPDYSRHRELSESYLNIFYLPFFGRFMAYRRSKKNFGPNVRYCFLGYIFALSFWLTKYHVTSHYLALPLCNIHSFLRMNPSCYKNRKAAAMTRNMVLSNKKGGARD